MGKIKDVRQQVIDRIKHKRKVATIVGVGGAVVSMLSVPFVIGLGAGVVVNDITAKQEADKIQTDVKGSSAYESFVDTKVQKLKDAFYNGEISYAEFKSQYENIGQMSTIKEFAVESNNELLQTQIQEIEDNEQTAEKILSRDLLGTLIVGAVGGVTFEIADLTDKKYKRKLRNLGVDEKELAD